MGYLNFDKASGVERDSLALFRAESWAKGLTSQEFCERNRILYEHPFGKNKIETFVLKNPENKIISSMDALQVKFFFRETYSHEIEEREGFLIASVITPVQHRHKGYASFLLKEFLSRQKWNLGILYSDIGPKFYEGLDFQKTGVQVREISEPFPKSKSQIQALEMPRWIEKVRLIRRKGFEQCSHSQMALVPEATFWDWQIERFRYLSKLKGQNLAEDSFFEIETQKGSSYFSVVANPLTKIAEVLWFDPDCPESLPAIGKVVQDWGLKKFIFWGAKSQGKLLYEECPMGWFLGATKPKPEGFYDPQLCDWW